MPITLLYTIHMKKVMLIYPPGEKYQRAEDRCQINIEASVANALRACNDLGYLAAILKKENYNIFLKDYMSERLSLDKFKQDIQHEQPDVIFISTTNGTIFYDLDIIKQIKIIKQDVIVILKGALFFNPDKELFSELDLTNVDYIIGGECEFIIKPLLEAHYNNKENLKNIQGICYKINEEWQINIITEFVDDLDNLPFPDRSLMPNNLYINPINNLPLATISTSRGCPCSCIYCISSLISGKKVRFRSVQSVYEEIKECYEKYKIKDFFFKSDTFTINKQWVLDLCNLILNSDLKGKINWVANSRANTIDEELLQKMKQAGCSVISIGFESGSDESLEIMKKGTTVAQNIQAVKLIKKYKLKIWGHYLIGFPWENKEHIEATRKLIFDLDTDFIELSIAVPFKGSELYKMVYHDIDEGRAVLGKDSFEYSTIGTKYLSKEYIKQVRKAILLKYHTRPSFILKKIFDKNLTLPLFLNYIKNGFRMINNILFK